MSKPIFDVFVTQSESLDIDMALFHYWLRGYKHRDVLPMYVEEIACEYDLQSRPDTSQSTGAASQLMRTAQRTRLEACALRDIKDQFRVFELLAQVLSDPPSLERQNLFPLGEGMEAELLEAYFTFDPHFARCVLGKRLSARGAKDLQSVAKKYRFRLRSCQRQYDNMVRVYKAIYHEGEEWDQAPLTTPVHVLIQRQFRLSSALARDYERIAFLSFYRFDTLQKKKLFCCSFADVVNFAQALIDEWTSPASYGRIDTELLEAFRMLKIPLLTRRALDAYCERVTAHLFVTEPLKLLSTSVSSRLRGRLQAVIKGLVSIASNLHKRKELPDLLVDLHDDIVRPLSKLNIKPVIVEFVFDSLISCAADSTAAAIPTNSPTSTVEPWLRFLRPCKHIVPILYERFLVPSQHRTKRPKRSSSSRRKS